MGKKTGQLLFKGDKKPKSKKHKSKKKRSDDDEKDDGVVIVVPSSVGEAADATVSILKRAPQSASTATNNTVTAAAAAATPTAPSIIKGSGRITTSGSVVMGHDTKFMKEIHQGDAIIVNDASSGQQEMRVVTMRLSDTSINLSSGFTTSLSNPTTFYYIRKPRNARREQHEKQKARAEETRERQLHAFDVYGGSGNDTLVYREKTETGSYRIKTQKLDDGSNKSERTRQELLELRAKKTSDKYC